MIVTLPNHSTKEVIAPLLECLEAANGLAFCEHEGSRAVTVAATRPNNVRSDGISSVSRGLGVLQQLPGSISQAFERHRLR